MPKNHYLPPAAQPDLIARREQIKRMRAAARAGKHIALTAWGGFGKTVAAAQLLSETGTGAAWLSAGPADNEPAHFYARLLAALHTLLPPGTKVSGTGPEAAALAASRLPLRGGRRFLALDDLHLLTNPEVLRHLPRIVAAMPRTATALFIGRAALPDALAQTGRGLLTLDEKDLAFSPEEAACLLPEGEEERAGLLCEWTGGWAMGLRALAMAPDYHLHDATPPTLAGYLDAGVWNMWNEGDQGFLLRCALPPEVNGELAKLLTGKGGGMERLAALQRGGAFLSRDSGGGWRFHELFRAWLNERAAARLGKEETARLRAACAEWYWGRDDFYTAARLYIENGDHGGINRCMAAQNRFSGSAQNLSAENKVHFINTYVAGLAPEFVEQNPYLLSKCANAAFLDGDAKRFTRYADALMARLPEFAAAHPGLAQTAWFIHSLDFRVPLRDITRAMAQRMQGRPITPAGEKGSAASSTITQNLPLMHRSMRDYAEYHALDEEDLGLLRATFGAMIGADYPPLEHSVIGGVWYERGELQQANHHALLAVRLCGEDTQPETAFSAHMLLAAVYDALGASREAAKLYAQMDAYTKTPEASFLRSNLEAMRASRALRLGEAAIAREWLALQPAAGRLSFCQMPRHFAALRAHIALGQNREAAQLGAALSAFCESYRRPVDQVESGVLTALALWRMGEREKALDTLAKQLENARPYGFVQQFVNEGREIQPLVWALREHRPAAPEESKAFWKRVNDAMYAAYGFAPQREEAPKLPPKQLEMLRYLAEGLTYGGIAEREGTGQGTVKSHVLKMYKAMGAHNAEEAVAKSKMLGLLE